MDELLTPSAPRKTCYFHICIGNIHYNDDSICSDPRNTSGTNLRPVTFAHLPALHRLNAVATNATLRNPQAPKLIWTTSRQCMIHTSINGTKTTIHQVISAQSWRVKLTIPIYLSVIGTWPSWTSHITERTLQSHPYPLLTTARYQSWRNNSTMTLPVVT